VRVVATLLGVVGPWPFITPKVLTRRLARDPVRHDADVLLHFEFAGAMRETECDRGIYVDTIPWSLNPIGRR